MAKYKIKSENFGIEHVGMYLRLSISWPVDDGTRETVVTGVITEIRFTTKYAPQRPVGTEVVLDLGLNDAVFLLPENEENDVADAIDDIHPTKG